MIQKTAEALCGSFFGNFILNSYLCFVNENTIAMKKFFKYIIILFVGFLVVKYAAKPFISDVMGFAEMFSSDNGTVLESVEVVNVEEDAVSDFEKYIKEADYYRKSGHPHAVNLVLGSLYTAYVLTDDHELKARIKEDIINEPKKSLIILSARWDGGNDFLVREENSLPLPGFEYSTTYGTWETPTKFMDYDQNPSTNFYNKDWAFTKDIPMNSYKKILGTYRFVFEKMVDGNPVRIDVPEDFYRVRYF